MQHSVYLQGDLGQRFGNKFTVHTDNYRDVFRCINANRPDFLPYIRKCHEEDIGFIIETAGDQIDQEDLLLPLQKGDITIAVAPAGSKKGIGKVILAIVMIYIMYQTGYVPPDGGKAGTWMMTKAGEMKAIGSVAVSMTTSLALQGIQQIMAPDPAVDQDNPTNYIFSGGASSQVEGDPVPLLYGELRVPGRPIAVDIRNGGRTGSNNTIPFGGGGGLGYSGQNHDVQEEAAEQKIP